MGDVDLGGCGLVGLMYACRNLNLPRTPTKKNTRRLHAHHNGVFCMHSDRCLLVPCYCVAENPTKGAVLEDSGCAGEEIAVWLSGRIPTLTIRILYYFFW